MEAECGVRRGDAVLVHAQVLEGVASRVAQRHPTLRLWRPDEMAIPHQSERVRVLLTSGNLPVDEALMARFPRLEQVAALAAGYEGIDIAAARARGIAVTNVALPDNSDMADWVLGALIYLLRDMAAGDRLVREGGWAKGWPALGPALAGRTIGIVGLGGIGIAVAERCAALGMKVIWWGPREKDTPYQRMTTIEALAAAADAVVLACPLSNDTRGIVDRRLLDLIGPAGFIVNVARGPVIDEPALIEALREGRIAGAALDVFETEPTDAGRWEGVPNVLLSPHRAGSTQERVAAMIDRFLDNIDRQFADLPLMDRVV